MYNRYIPQSDGSYSRNRVTSEPRNPHSAPCPPPPPPSNEPVPAKVPCHAGQESGAGGFLKNLIPKDFDTGDLMILLLLLLMAGDCREDQNWAWLTLALYLFL